MDLTNKNQQQLLQRHIVKDGELRREGEGEVEDSTEFLEN